MGYSFKTILVPVDFSVNTEVAVKKALVLADETTTIHLLHVQKNDKNGLSNLSLGFVTDDTQGSEKLDSKTKMAQWKESIEG